MLVLFFDEACFRTVSVRKCICVSHLIRVTWVTSIHLWYLIHLRFQQQHRSAFLSYWTWLFCTTCVPIWDAGVTPSGRGGRNETILGVVGKKNGKMQCSYPPASLLANHWIFVHCICCVLEAVDRRWNAVVRNCETHPINACHDKCQVFNPKDAVHHIQSHSCTNWRWIGWMMNVWFPIVGWGANRDANQSNVRHGARWYGPDT